MRQNHWILDFSDAVDIANASATGFVGSAVPRFMCPKHEDIGSWVFQFHDGKHVQHYCPYCLRDLAIEYPKIDLAERVKLLDPVYPWTDELTKEDFEES